MKRRQVVSRVAFYLLLACAISYSGLAPLQETIARDNNKPEIITYHVSSGTGFFVQPNYVVTNKHVVETCQFISLRNASIYTPAQIIATDARNDLALLKTQEQTPHIATLRVNNNLRLGEQVTVIGYPKEHGITGTYSTVSGKILDLNGPLTNDNRIQFSDMVEKGNSGGPLIDGSGNIIGVVVGKVNYYEMGIDIENDREAEPVKTTGIAINLNALKNFLDQNHVYYNRSSTQYGFVYNDVEPKAKDFIVNIHCILN